MKGKYITLQILLACLSKPVDEEQKLKNMVKGRFERDIELMKQWKLKIQLAANDKTAVASIAASMFIKSKK